jgi:hypothetical protein
MKVASHMRLAKQAKQLTDGLTGKSASLCEQSLFLPQTTLLQLLRLRVLLPADILTSYHSPTHILDCC